ncbi:MAG: serine--tRNA ligase, partial [Oscillospiraceae bacterium]|nr:serine--tRNA ligase [Oscillospiraceae bacterium]
MLDIKLIRDNPDLVKEKLATRNGDFSHYIDEISEIDKERRILSTETDKLKAEQNNASKKIPAMKKAREDTTALMAQMKEFSESVKIND